MAKPNIMYTLHVLIEGRVQGVGFRYFVQEKAADLELAGWVRNLPNGSVEAVAQGSRAALEQWLKNLRQGPPMSRINDVIEEWESSTDSFERFEIR